MGKAALGSILDGQYVKYDAANGVYVAVDLGSAALHPAGDFDSAGAAAAAAAASLPRAGGTMTGKIVLDGDPTANLHPATKQYVASQIAALIAGAPSTLDTLNEIAAQLGTDESAVSALTATVAGKLAASANLGDLANVITAQANLGLGSAAPKNVASSGDASSGQVVKGDDSRLTNTRTPSDATVTAAKVAGSLKPSGSAVAGDEALRALGTSAATAAAGNDSRLSDSRTPTGHHTRHSKGGDDAIALADIATVMSDVPTALIDGLMPRRHVFSPTELLLPTSLVGTWQSTITTAVIANEYISNASVAQNDELDFDIPLSAGTWRLTFRHHKGTNKPIYTFKFDGTTVGTIDGYNGSTVNNASSTISGISVAASGKVSLKMILASKNASSSGYVATFSWLTLDRTA